MATPVARDLARFLLRELASVRMEIEAYPTDESIWQLPPGVPNSAGTLTLHVAGNLRHYLGAVLGHTGYLRDRDAEFSTRGLTRRQLLEHVTEAEDIVAAILPGIPESALSAPFPETFRGATLSTQEVLLQLAVHLAYHLGQIDYHRRLLTGAPQGVDALSARGLNTERVPQAGSD